jgi:hypothetical protein
VIPPSRVFKSPLGHDIACRLTGRWLAADSAPGPPYTGELPGNRLINVFSL